MLVGASRPATASLALIGIISPTISCPTFSLAPHVRLSHNISSLPSLDKLRPTRSLSAPRSRPSQSRDAARTRISCRSSSKASSPCPSPQAARPRLRWRPSSGSCTSAVAAPASSSRPWGSLWDSNSRSLSEKCSRDPYRLPRWRLLGLCTCECGGVHTWGGCDWTR